MRLWIATRVTLAHGLAGGMERHTELLATGLAARGHQVTVASTAHPDGRTSGRTAGVERVHLPGSSWRRYEPQWWTATYERLRAVHGDEPVDAVVSQSAGALGWLARARAELGIPTLVVLHTSLRGELRRAWSAARTPRGSCHLALTAGRAPELFLRWRRAAPTVAGWAAVSETVAADVRREIGIPDSRVVVVPPGIDLERFRPDPTIGEAWRATSGLTPDERVLVVASRLEAPNGVAVAIEAVARLRGRREEVVLVVAGAGSQAAALRRTARVLGVAPAVRFLGAVDHDELPAVLAAADLFLLPSLAPEGLPLGALEASAAGLAVVASDAPGVREAVVDGATGIVVAPGDPDALAGAVDVLLSDTARRRQLGNEGRARAERHFGQAAMAEAVERLLVEAVEKQRRQ
jgi:glycosyltransferase involved in cell wall biosynthesis